MMATLAGPAGAVLADVAAGGAEGAVPEAAVCASALAPRAEASMQKRNGERFIGIRDSFSSV